MCMCVCANTHSRFVLWFPLLPANNWPNSLLPNEYLFCLKCFALTNKITLKILLHLSLASCTCISVGVSPRKGISDPGVWTHWVLINTTNGPPRKQVFLSTSSNAVVCENTFLPRSCQCWIASLFHFCQSDKVKNSSSFYLAVLGYFQHYHLFAVFRFIFSCAHWYKIFSFLV